MSVNHMSGTEADSINKGYSSTSLSPGTNGVSTSEVQHGIGKQGFGQTRDAVFGLLDFANPKVPESGIFSRIWVMRARMTIFGGMRYLEGFGIWRDALFGGMRYLEGFGVWRDAVFGGATMSGLMPV